MTVIVEFSLIVCVFFDTQRYKYIHYCNVHNILTFHENDVIEVRQFNSPFGISSEIDRGLGYDRQY